MIGYGLKNKQRTTESETDIYVRKGKWMLFIACCYCMCFYQVFNSQYSRLITVFTKDHSLITAFSIKLSHHKTPCFFLRTTITGQGSISIEGTFAAPAPPLEFNIKTNIYDRPSPAKGK